MAYHAGIGVVSGGYVGVDVFFVISGYLITSHLVKQGLDKGRVDFVRFYANRFRRLAIPALLVTVTTMIAVRLWAPAFHMRQHAIDGAFASVYAINYWLAARGIDYQHGAGPQSVFQHYWSLAVEEQFYLVWPVLVALCLRAGRNRLGRTLMFALSVIIVVSLITSVLVTASNAPLAYFSLQTRAWELAAGSLIAVTPRLSRRLAGWPAGLACWVGVGAIVWSALAFDDRTAFPGYAAALPVAGACLLVLAGGLSSRSGVHQLLRSAPMTGIGAVSYGWYLWHWPVLVLAPAVVGRPLPLWQKLLLMVAALGLAWVSYRFVEEPARRSSSPPRVWWRRGLTAAAAGVAVSLAVFALGPNLAGTGPRDTVPTLGVNDVGTAQAAIRHSLTLTAVPRNLTPSLEEAVEEAPETTRNGCHASLRSVDNPPCVFGNPQGSRTVVLFGDSHAEQWLPALDEAAQNRGWRVISWTKAACPIAEVELYEDQLKRTYTECDTWREKTRQRIIAERPDLVILSQSDSIPGTNIETPVWAQATATSAAKLTAAGVPTIFLLDTTRPQGDNPECLAEHLEDIQACHTPLDKAWRYGDRHQQVAAALTAARVPTVEPVGYLCADRVCPPLVGNLLVYRDDSHLTIEYATWLAPFLIGILDGPPARPR